VNRTPCIAPGAKRGRGLSGRALLTCLVAVLGPWGLLQPSAALAASLARSVHDTSGFQSLTMYTSFDESTATATGPAVSTISNTVPKIYALAQYANWQGTHTDIFDWIAPDGSVYYHSVLNPYTYNGTFNTWSRIGIAGYKPASLPGTWSVRLSHDGSLVATQTFTITAAATATPPPPIPVPTVAPTPTAPRPPPASVDFRLISQRVEAYGTKPDFEQVKPPLERVTLGKKVQWRIYFYVNNASPGQQVLAHWTVKHAGRLVYHNDYTGYHLSQTNPIDTYWVGVLGWRPPSAGRYTILGTITIGTVTKQATTPFTVLGKTPPAPPPVSFRFDGLVVLRNGRPGTTFPTNQPMTIVATFTVQHLPTPQEGTIRRVFQLQFPGKGFQAVSVGSDNLVALNGKNSNRHVFTPQLRGLVRIKVGIQIGRNFRQRQLDIRLT